MRINFNSTRLTSLVLFVIFGLGTFTKSVAQANYNDLLGQVNTITTSVPFLLISPDARSGALGETGVSSTPDISSQHWNPAKYAFMENKMGVAVSYSPWLRQLVDDISLGYLTGYYKLNDMQAISASLRYFSLGDIIFTDRFGNVVGQYRPNEFALDAAYSRKFTDNLSGAVTLRYIYSNLTGGFSLNTPDSKPGQTAASDISLFYTKEIDFGPRDANFAFGANISNIGAKISYTETTERNFIPINLRFGPSFTIDIDEYNTMSFMIDINKLLVPTPPIYKRDSMNQLEYDLDGNPLIALGRNPDVGIVTGMLQSFYDAPGGFNEEMKEVVLAAGVEYWYDKQFALRGGIFLEDKTKGGRKFATLGAGLKYNVFQLDFAYLIPFEQKHPLENTLRFSLSFDFEALQKESQNPEG